MINAKTPTPSPLEDGVEASQRQLRTGPRGRTGYWVAGPRHYAYRHGLRKRPEYMIWHCMIRRCEDPRRPEFKYYGGRGITVCELWRHDFGAFYQDMGPRPSHQHSIERKDNSKGYSPDNCKWALKIEQAQNKSNNRLVTFAGETLPLLAMARKHKIGWGVLQFRLNKGWSPEKAITTPVTVGRTFLTFRGDTLHLAEMARRYGITKDALGQRLKRGWSLARALNQRDV